MKLLLRTSFDAQTLSNTIKKPDRDTTEVGDAGTQLFCFLYEVSKEDTHSTIRYAKWNDGLLVTKLNRVELQHFPNPQMNMQPTTMLYV